MSWKRIFLKMQTEITYVLHSFDIRETNDRYSLFTTEGLTSQCHSRYEGMYVSTKYTLYSI